MRYILILNNAHIQRGRLFPLVQEINIYKKLTNDNYTLLDNATGEVLCYKGYVSNSLVEQYNEQHNMVTL